MRLSFRMLRTAGTSALMLATPYAALAQSEPAAINEEALSALVTAYDVAGAAVVELSGCEPGPVVTTGLANIEADEPVGPNTVFEAASLSKPVFAYLTMMLVDEGVIDLDQPISETFDYPRIADRSAYAAITPRMILTHRTGLPNWVDEATPFAERTAPLDFVSAPGAEYTYSGEAFQLLQAFVEHNTGKSLQELFAERLGEDMSQSAFARPLPEDASESRGYRRASSPETGRSMTNVRDFPMAAGSLSASAGDFARFLARVCRAEGLTPDMHAEMISPLAAAPEEDAPFPMAFGLGWIVADIGGDIFVGHGGNNGEYRAFAGYMTGSGDGIVILTNSETGQNLIEALTTPEHSDH